MHESKAKEIIIDPDSPHSSPSSFHEEHANSVDNKKIEPEKSLAGEKNVAPSIASSIHECDIVPRHLRRGLLGRFTIIPETPTPYFYPQSTKWTITLVVALAGAAAPMGSAILLPALSVVSRDFGITDSVTNLSVALYMLSMSIFPLWWSSFSETLGRRTIYLVSFALFVLFAVLSAIARNIAMLIVMRMLSGASAASVQAVGAGTIADIWQVHERGKAMGIFYLGPLLGPFLAPIIGGALTKGFGWRATQWFLVIWGTLLSCAILLLLPETLIKRKKAPESGETREKDKVLTAEQKTNSSPKQKEMAALDRPLPHQSMKQNTEKIVVLLKRCLVDPLKIILLLRFPAVAITVYYAAITFGSLYFLNISIERTFSRPPYNFSTLIVGLLYIPNSIGYFLSSVFGGRWLDHIMKREARKAGRYDEKGKLVFQPEDRMCENAWIACFLFPAALIWYGWSVEKEAHWIVPMIANFFFGVGSMMIFAMATTMLTEFMWREASTGIAVNNFVRNIFSCVGGLVAAPLINAIGNGWLCTILGLVSLISGIAVIMAMKRYSKKWRIEMERKMGP